MRKANMPFEERRKAMLDNMSARANSGSIEEKTIHFQNDDVPNFLKELDEFEKRSRETLLIAK